MLKANEVRGELQRRWRCVDAHIARTESVYAPWAGAAPTVAWGSNGRARGSSEGAGESTSEHRGSMGEHEGDHLHGRGMLRCSVNS